MNSNSAVTSLVQNISANKYKELYTAISKLSVIQTRVIQMRFWEQLTIDQIASVIGLTWDEADELINLTLKELRFLIENQNHNMPMPQAA
jgi:DNA-directed RNA polymerase specialized sigma24 family protein